MKHCGYLLVIIVYFLINGMHAQNTTYLAWQDVYGEPSIDEEVAKIAVAENGNFVALGNVGDLIVYDFLLMHYDHNNTLLSVDSIGGSNNDRATDIVFVSGEPNTYIISGYSESDDMDIPNNYGGTDGCLLKVNATTGAIDWILNLGGSDLDELECITKDNAGFYYAAGFTKSDDLDLADNELAGAKDLWLLKFDAAGNIIWQKTYGGSGNDSANDLDFNPVTNELVVVGASSSNDGDFTGNNGLKDILVARFDTSGTMLFHQQYGGAQADTGTCFDFTQDGELCFAAEIFSTDGDITVPTLVSGTADIWLANINSEGTIVWQRAIGEALEDSPNDILYIGNNELLLVGETKYGSSFPPFTLLDVLLCRINTINGNVLQYSKYGGSLFDAGNCIVPKTENSYLVGGYSDSTDGDLLINGEGRLIHGADDVWIFSLLEVPTGINNGINLEEINEVVRDFVQINIVNNNLLEVSYLFNQVNSRGGEELMHIRLYNIQGQMLLEKKRYVQFDQAASFNIDLSANLQTQIIFAEFVLNDHVKYLQKIIVPH